MRFTRQVLRNKTPFSTQQRYPIKNNVSPPLTAHCCRSPTLDNAAVRPVIGDFRCTRKLRDGRIHRVRTKRPFARAANAGAAIARTCGKFIAAVRPTSPKQPLKPVIRCQIQIALSPRRDRTSRSRTFPTVGRISSKVCFRIAPF